MEIDSWICKHVLDPRAGESHGTCAGSRSENRLQVGDQACVVTEQNSTYLALFAHTFGTVPAHSTVRARAHLI